MPYNDTDIKKPIVNVMTKNQYDNLSNPSPTEFYLITNDTNIIAGDGIEVITSSNGQSLINNTCKPLQIGFTPADSTQTEWEEGVNEISLDTALSVEELFDKLEQGEDISFVDRLSSIEGIGTMGKFWASEWYSDGIEIQIKAFGPNALWASQTFCYIRLVHNTNNDSDEYSLIVSTSQGSGSGGTPTPVS